MWRKMLKQESEHQWLAISAFFIFIIIGAIFIRGTGQLPGVDLTESELGNDHRILNSLYLEQDESIMLAFINGNYQLFAISGNQATELTGVQSEYDVSKVSDLEMLTNRSALIVNGDDDVLLYSQGKIMNFTTSYGNNDFSVSSIEQSSNQPENYLMITTEIDNQQSIRGLNTTGITSTNTPTNENVVWEDLQHVGDDKWIATGKYNPPANTGTESPAAPDIKPAWATIIWNGGVVAPTIESLHIGGYGEYHAVLILDNHNTILAGSHETILFDHVSGDVENIEYTSVAAVSDKSNTAWLFNGKGSKSVMKLNGNDREVESLPHDIPIDIETIGFDGITIFMHGTNDEGQSKVLSFDTSAIGSIESGSGFINLAFIVVSMIMFGIMAINIFDKLKR